MHTCIVHRALGQTRPWLWQCLQLILIYLNSTCLCLPLLPTLRLVTLVHQVYVMAVGTVRLHSFSHQMDVDILMDVNLLMDVNNLSHRLALTVGLVSHLRLTTDLINVKPASRLLRTIAVRPSTTTTTVVGPSDVLILSATGRIDDLTINDRTIHALLTSVHVHLLLSIDDPIPALRPVAAVLDVLFVEPLIVILAIIVRNPVTVGRTSILLLLLLLTLIRFVKVHQDLLLHHVVTRKTTCGFRGRALGDPTTTLAHLPVRSGAPGYPSPGCTKSPAP